MAVRNAGQRRRTPRLDISWLPNAVGHPRLGLVVPRHGQSAVKRNLLRRRLREMMRRNVLPQLASLDLLVRPQPPAYKAAPRQLAHDIDAWRRSLSA